MSTSTSINVLGQKGHFVAIGDEVKEFQNLVENGKVSSLGRHGVYYDQQALIYTIKSKKKIDKSKIHIVTVQVSHDQVINPLKSTEKFGYRGSPGVTIESVIPFEKVA